MHLHYQTRTKMLQPAPNQFFLSILNLQINAHSFGTTEYSVKHTVYYTP